jgi:hypothetical protein
MPGFQHSSPAHNGRKRLKKSDKQLSASVIPPWRGKTDAESGQAGSGY